MTDYPYTLNPGNLEDFLRNMPDRPQPRKVTYEYLSSVGYTSSNDRAIATILKFIGFLEGNKPTDLFKSFRDTTKSGSIMAQALKESYADLLELSANPCEVRTDALENFFRTKTGRGGRTLSATVRTFEVLCGFADFGAAPVTTTAPTPTPTPTAGITGVRLPVTKEGIRLDVSIRIELPVTQDASVYDKIFESLKKHLLTPSSETD